MPESLVESTPLPAMMALNAVLPALFNTGKLKPCCSSRRSACPGPGPAAGHQREAAGTLRPDALIVCGIHAATGQETIKCGLAGVVQRGPNRIRIR